MNDKQHSLQEYPVIFGEVLFDCFEDGSRVLGGAPFNVAWHLKAFGFDPLLLSRVGCDAMGREIRETMSDWKIRLRGLQEDPKHPTGEVRIRLCNGQPEFEIKDDRAYDHIDALNLPDAEPSLIYHGTLALRHSRSTEALAALLRQCPAPVFMDVNLRDPWWRAGEVQALMSRANWLKINDVELGLLTGSGSSLRSDAENLLARHDLDGLIVTLGSKGAFFLNPHGDYIECAPETKVEVADTVGAGDGFASVCITGLLKNWPWQQTMTRAQHFASLLVSQRGAIISNPEIYRDLREQWQ